MFSLCGADWPEDIDLYTSRLTVLLRLPSGPTVINDAMGALRAGSPDGVGVALTLGHGRRDRSARPGRSLMVLGHAARADRARSSSASTR